MKILPLALTLAIPLSAIATETRKETTSESDPTVAQSVISIAAGGVDAVKGQLTQTIDGGIENWISNKLASPKGVTEVSVTGVTGSSPAWSVLLVRPLEDKTHYGTFVQSSVFRQNDRTTINLGYGYRKLIDEKKILLGTNIFYDHELPYNHQRISVGGEVRSTIGELNANIYRGMSNWRLADSGFEEKALSGYDLELAVAIPYIRTAHFRVKNFKWNGVDDSPDLKGNSISVSGLIASGLRIEYGRTDFRNSTDTNFLRLTYSIDLDGNQRMKSPKISKTAYSLESMESRMFEKVARENRIIKAKRRSGFQVTAIGY